jgi:hypothetical protein
MSARREDWLIWIGGYNRRFDKPIFFSLNPFNMKGVSPPYDNELFFASEMAKGTQEYYIAFPKTSLLGSGFSGASGKDFNKPNDAGFSFVIEYGIGLPDSVFSLTSPKGGIDRDLPLIYYFFDKNMRPTYASAGDAGFNKWRLLTPHCGLPPITDRVKWENELISQIIVFKGDSIIYPANQSGDI